MTDKNIDLAREIIKKAKKVVVFTGAGMSAESGINTFRDPEAGTWSNKLGLALFGTPIGWKLMPRTAWGKYLEFRRPIAEAEPNDGHIAIVRLSEIKNGSLDIITQNVDGLHQKAGSNPDKVYEIHGSVNRHKCIKKWHKHPYIIDPSKQRRDYDYLKDPFFTGNAEGYPTCRCGSYLRPDTILFTEQLPSNPLNRATIAVKRLEKDDCMIVIGTSGTVYPAAGLVNLAIQRNGVKVIEINKNISNFSANVDIFLKGLSGEILPEII